jgi:hypothetical protein
MWAVPRGSFLPTRNDFLKIKELAVGILRREQYLRNRYFPVLLAVANTNIYTVSSNKQVSEAESFFRS